MLTLPPTVKVMVCPVPVDMRKSFDGLAGVTRSLLQLDPLSGHLLVFFNRAGDHARILFWDRNGYCLVCKRLERGRFRLPWEGADEHPRYFELEACELALILEGIDLSGAKRRARWIPGEVPPADSGRARDKRMTG